MHLPSLQAMIGFMASTCFPGTAFSRGCSWVGLNSFRTVIASFVSRAVPVCLIALCAGSMKADDAHPLLVRWLEAQSRVRTWSADLVQTRTLKTVARPLTSRGHIWFAAPNRFRWELGEPPQTIAVREAAEMVVLYPRLKRAERYPLANLSSGPMKDLLTLIEAGFPRSQSELESQFLVLGVEEREGMGEIRLQPKSAMARKFMPELRIIVDRENLHPRATEMRFADGSTMRNDFSNPKINQSIEDATFHATIPVDFKTVEPMRKELGK